MRLEEAPPALFQDQLVPRDTRLVGLAALVHALQIAAPLRRPSCVADGHIRGSHRREDNWTIYDKRYWPGPTLADHLSYAIRHEELDLPVLARILKAAPQDDIKQMVLAAPTSAPGRRIWYLHELLTGTRLDVPDAPNVAAVNFLDPKSYFTAKPKLSRRHRVRDNLLGTKDFCPMIRRTPALEAHIASNLADSAREVVGRTGAHVIARAASFMLLADSRASFEIEGERPPRNRLERWGRAVLQAGKNKLTLDEIIRLHAVLIEDMRFIEPGLRTDGVFLGERDPEGVPLPEFIGARPDNLSDLVQGLLTANERMRASGIDPVLQATATAFGFVYVHPFGDGNGRVHRCLVHHVLAERKFTPSGMVFPVSSVMQDRIDDYRRTLQEHSGPLMPFIEWRSTPNRNVEVTNDTADFYRYFDATGAAEFLYGCVKRTVEQDLPREIDYLRRHDQAVRLIMERVEMPDSLAKDLVMFVRQNNGSLARRRREREFRALADDELADLETIVLEAFDGFVENHEPPE
ncbi:MAG: Fic family protein [Alphaproteobacteria bacterium]|nr:Fic family protein [Alphaproteobacteria bacterium]